MISRVFTVLSIILVAWPTASMAKKRSSSKSISPDWKYVEKRLAKAGLKKPFVEALQETYEKEDFKNVLELNILMFLKKGNYHGAQVTDDSVENIRDFLEENKKTLKRAEKEHGVPGPVIASLLWMESRYGQNTGRFHVPSVYVDLMQARRSKIIHYLQTDGSRRFTNHVGKSASVKIAQRAKKKADWALDELKALEKIYMEHGKIALAMRGSFSGAGGLPQFLPSSYLMWACSKKPRSAPDLNKTDDAILSVANFLHNNGWRKKSKTHVKALMNYNNSQDYANAILDLAARAKGRSGRTVATEAVE